MQRRKSAAAPITPSVVSLWPRRPRGLGAPLFEGSLADCATARSGRRVKGAPFTPEISIFESTSRRQQPPCHHTRVAFIILKTLRCLFVFDDGPFNLIYMQRTTYNDRLTTAHRASSKACRHSSKSGIYFRVERSRGIVINSRRIRFVFLVERFIFHRPLYSGGQFTSAARIANVININARLPSLVSPD